MEEGSSSKNILNESVLVLNKYYTAIRIIDAKRAFSLLYKDNAEAIEQENSQFYNYGFDDWLTLSEVKALETTDHEVFVHTPCHSLLIPKVIRLVTYDKIPKREVKFNRKNILARDGNRCQYCGKKFPASKLSIDHIIPKSRGGKTNWSNVITACNPCNTKKGGHLPSEAGMRLISKPEIPKRHPILVDKVKNDRYQSWLSFIHNPESVVEA